MSLLPWCVALLFVDSLRFQAAVRALKQMQRWITERSCLVHGSAAASLGRYLLVETFLPRLWKSLEMGGDVEVCLF